MLHVLFELKQLSECSSRAADKLVVLAECKPRPADKLDDLAERKSRVADKRVFTEGSRAAGVMELANRSRATGKVKLSDRSRAASKVELLSASQGLLATYFGNCWLQRLAAPLKILALIFYCGIAHKFEFFAYQLSCLEALHPAFEINCTLLVLMKQC